LQSQYDAGDRNINPNPWEFKDGHSAGVCVEGSGFYEANTYDLRQAFDDAFVSFHIPMQISSGAGVIPYLPQNWFDSVFNAPPDDPLYLSEARFHQIWFKNKNAYTCNNCINCCNKNQNYIHILGSSEFSDANAKSWKETDYSYIFVDTIISNCQGCSAEQINNHIMSTTAHEMGHQFDINSDTSANKCPLFHCSNDAWCGLPGGSCVNPAFNEEYCLMRRAADPNTGEMRIDNIYRFDCNELFELVNQCGVLTDCSLNKSIRTINDPI
jgi:hypothetical protein